MLDDFDELVLSQGQREGKVADASIERSRETARGVERSDGCELTSVVFVNFSGMRDQRRFKRGQTKTEEKNRKFGTELYFVCLYFGCLFFF